MSLRYSLSIGSSSRVVRVLILGAWLLAACSVLAETFEGKVVRVYDGDTLTVLANNQQIRVRLIEIDAPEQKQAFGKRSQQSMYKLCGGRLARVTWNIHVWSTTRTAPRSRLFMPDLPAALMADGGRREHQRP